MRTSRPTTSCILVLLAAVTLAGCGGDEQARDQRDGAGAAAAKQPPDGWPDGIELPAGSRIRGSTDVDEQVSVSVETDDTLDEVVAHFEDELAGWQVEQASRPDSKLSAFLTWTRAGERFTLIVSEAAEVRTFVATVAPGDLDATASAP